MAEFVLGPSSKALLGQFDLSGDMKTIAMPFSRDEKDTTRWGVTYAQVLAGLRSGAVTLEGDAQYGAVALEANLRALRATNGVPFSYYPENDTEESYGYLMGVAQSDVGLDREAHGDLAAFSYAGEGSGGNIAEVQSMTPLGEKTVTGNSTGFNIGTVAVTDRLYCALHVTAVSAPTTLDVIIESAALADFIGSTTQATFTTITTAVGSQLLVVPGTAITDPWWRAAWTIAGTGYTFQCGFAIQGYR